MENLEVRRENSFRNAPQSKIMVGIIVFIIGISSLNLIFAQTTYSDCSIYGNCQPTKAGAVSVNYSLVDTNNSFWLNGANWTSNTYYKFWYNYTLIAEGYCDGHFLNLSGTNANQPINLGNENLSTQGNMSFHYQIGNGTILYGWYPGGASYIGSWAGYFGGAWQNPATRSEFLFTSPPTEYVATIFSDTEIGDAVMRLVRGTTIRMGFYPFASDYRYSHDNFTSMQNVIFEKDLLVRDDLDVTDDLTCNGDAVFNNVSVKNVSAVYFKGNGSLLTGITSSSYNSSYHGYNSSYGKFWNNQTLSFLPLNPNLNVSFNNANIIGNLTTTNIKLGSSAEELSYPTFATCGLHDDFAGYMTIRITFLNYAGKSINKLIVFYLWVSSVQNEFNYNGNCVASDGGQGDLGPSYQGGWWWVTNSTGGAQIRLDDATAETQYLQLQNPTDGKLYSCSAIFDGLPP